MLLSRKLAFSLTEVLIVVFIIALLAAISLPVFAGARKSAFNTNCIANLHQASYALQMYSEDVGDYPGALLLGKQIRATSPMTAYARSSTKLFHCKHDHPSGRAGRPLEDRREPRSYAETWFLWEGQQGKEAWRQLLSIDPNPIVFRCNFHDDRIRPLLLSHDGATRYGWTYGGPALAARRDGSVKWDRRPLYGTKLDVKEIYWKGSTAEPCPSAICDGLPPPEGLRED